MPISTTLKGLEMNKQFSQSLHDQCDEFGRDVVKKFAQSFWNVEVIDNPDKYGIDLIFMKDGKPTAYAEVEVRLSWKTKEFPYLDLNVPFRKKKLLSNTDLPTFFFSVNKDGTALFHCDAEAVLSSDVEESRNKYVGKGERFFKVPLHLLDYVVL